MVPVRYNVRSILVRRSTSFATVFGIAMVVFVVSAAMMLVNGIRRTLGRSGRSDNAIVLRTGSGTEIASHIEDETARRIMTAPGIRRAGNGPDGVAEVVSVLPLTIAGGDGTLNVAMRGVVDASVPFRPALHVTEGKMARFEASEALMGRGLVGRIQGAAIGQTVNLRSSTITIVGVFDDDGSAYESEIWLDRDVLRAAAGKQGLDSSIHVRLESAASLALFKGFVESDKDLGCEVYSEPQYFEKQSEGMALLVGGLGALVSVFCSIGAIIGAMITMYGTIANRQKEIGTLRALGFSRRNILASFLLEAIILTIAGGTVGALASVALGGLHVSMLNGTSFSEVVLSFEPTVPIIAKAIAAAALMGIAGGFWPAVRAARIPPVVAMRGS